SHSRGRYLGLLTCPQPQECRACSRKWSELTWRGYWPNWSTPRWPTTGTSTTRQWRCSGGRRAIPTTCGSRSSGSGAAAQTTARRCRASPASDQLFFLGGEGAAEVRRRHPVVVDELAGRAGQADGAALEHVGPGGDLQAGPGVLLDQQHGQAAGPETGQGGEHL